ncbi:hypothetical protein IJT17_10515 [bacterium]|nr:hypothetical protein [bacterium]
MNKHRALKTLICLGLAGVFHGAALAQEPTGQDDMMPPPPRSVFGSEDVSDERGLPPAEPVNALDPADGNATDRAVVPPQEPAAQRRPGTHSRDAVREMQNRAGADDAAQNAASAPSVGNRDAVRAAEEKHERPAMRRPGTHSRDSVRGMQNRADADEEAAQNAAAAPSDRNRDAVRAAEEKHERPAMRRPGTHSRDSVRGMGLSEEPRANAGVSSSVSGRAEVPSSEQQGSQAVRPRGTRPGKTVRGYTGPSVPSRSAAPAPAEKAFKMPEPRQVAPGQYGEDLSAIVAEELRSLGKRHE